MKAVLAADAPREDEEEVSLGSSDTDSEDDEDYIPEKRPKRRAKSKKKKVKKVKPPNLTELSLPKPASRLDPTLDLGDAALTSAFCDDNLDLSSMVSPSLPDAPPSAHVRLLVGRRPTRGTPDVSEIAEYRAIYSVQLPGMPFYYDAFHALLTTGASNDHVVSAGATFRLLVVTTAEVSVLVVDILALAVNPQISGRGLGSTLVAALKSIARREASARGGGGGAPLRPLLLTQVHRLDMHACTHVHGVHVHVLTHDAAAPHAGGSELRRLLEQERVRPCAGCQRTRAQPSARLRPHDL